MAIIMIGNEYGNLTVIKEAGKNKRGILFECVCKCGNNIVLPGKDLRSGNNKSCGCLLKKHGMSKTRIYSIWQNMKRRCDDSTHKDFKNYGGRGIKYCDKWVNFEGFYKDMGSAYKENLTLDRKDVHGGYSKENCQWVSFKQQQNNKRNNVFYLYKGESLTLPEIADKYGYNYDLLRNRIKRGASLETAIASQHEKETITYKGITKTVGEYAKEIGMTYNQLKKRLMKGWTVERAIEKPLKKRTK